MVAIASSVFGVTDFETRYPPSVQMLSHTEIYEGDVNGEFEGDYVAILSDATGWKIHPEDRHKYESWSDGDKVRIKHVPNYSNRYYWREPRLKRLHRFVLYNQSRDEECQVMFVKKESNPIRRIEAVDYLFFSFDETFGYTGKILRLSDGSIWEIKTTNKFNCFLLGSSVYVGVQGTPNVDFDYILITEVNGEIIATRAKLLSY